MNAINKKHPGGRPSKLTNELLCKATEYLDNYELHGDVIPTVAAMAHVLDTSRERLHRWAADRNKREFRHLMNRLKAIQERALLNGGLNSTMNTTIAKLILTKHGYTDNPQANQGPAGITVQVNRGSVVLKSGGQEVAIETDSQEVGGRTLEHGEE